MCFYSKSILLSAWTEKTPDQIKELLEQNYKKVAEKDIPVYKVLTYKDEHYQSPYQNCLYKVEEEKKAAIFSLLGKVSCAGIMVEHFLRIKEGLHSYKTLEAAQKCASCSGYRCIARMVIPKGTVYYENSTEFVSECLYWAGVIVPKSGYLR